MCIWEESFLTILDKILQVKKTEVEKLRQDFTRSYFESSPHFARKPMDMKRGLREHDGIGIIAEIKKASPSRGLIREKFDHMEIARTYFKHEVQAVSILTDRTFFQGDIRFLNEIAAIKTVPLLRKDFIIDEYQVLEAKANGADLILLIAEALSKLQILELTQVARECNLDTLVELHSPAELDKIDFTQNDLIGVNNRDLTDFSIDLSRTAEIGALLPAQVTLVSESGIEEKKDVDRLHHTRTRAVLVGTHLMASTDADKTLSELKQWCTNAG